MPATVATTARAASHARASSSSPHRATTRRRGGGGVVVATPRAPARRRVVRGRARPVASSSSPSPSPPSPSADAAVPPASSRGGLVIRDLEYTPIGSGAKILTGRTSLSLSPRGLCLLVGRSGHGKSTLLTLVSGLAEPTGGVITFSDLPLDDHLPSAMRNARVGIVFQFPERHFLGRTVLSELTFGWPTKAEYYPRRRELATRMQSALEAVGMLDVPLDTEVRSLSGGYKRRLALAIQLVRDPHVLCLDEPLAGLDWKARADVVALLDALRRDRAVVVVSHDVEEVSPIADVAYRMSAGGVLTEAPELAGAGAAAFGDAVGEFAAF